MMALKVGGVSSLVPLAPDKLKWRVPERQGAGESHWQYLRILQVFEAGWEAALEVAREVL